ncbi:MAG: methionine ABC transporter permease, partial [Lachnospiraceae bacterium]|nr:methionine ABC transporter permease [Lachnospiraceae bacterium]
MSEYIIEAIKRGVLETLTMTGYASLFAYAGGLPLGILLYATAKDRLLQNRPVNYAIGLVVNIMRSLPFLILLVLLIPFTRWVT